MTATKVTGKTDQVPERRYESIKDRLMEVDRVMAILSAVLGTELPDGLDDDLREALADMTDRAKFSLLWLTRLPGSVLNLPAPADDDLDLLASELNSDEIVERIINERLSQ